MNILQANSGDAIDHQDSPEIRRGTMESREYIIRYNTVHGAMLQIREGMRIEVRFSIRMGKKYLTKRTVHRVELIQRGLHNSQRQAFLLEIVYSLW